MARAAAQSSVLILLDFIWFSQPLHRCCFALFSIRKIRHFLTQHVTQLLVQEWWSPTLTSAMHQTKADPCESATSQAQVTYAELHITSWNCFLCLNSLVRAHATSRLLHSAHERCLAKPSVQAPPFRLVFNLVPQWWNDLPSPVRPGATLSFFKKLVKTQLLSATALLTAFILSPPLPPHFLFR